jgi:hypothetical protein
LSTFSAPKEASAYAAAWDPGRPEKTAAPTCLTTPSHRAIADIDTIGMTRERVRTVITALREGVR